MDLRRTGDDYSDRAVRAAGVLWSRRELRRRIVPLVALGLLTGLAASVGLSAFAGARRSATAYDRLVEATDGADAVVFASQADIFNPDWTDVAALPYIEAAGSFGIPFVDVVETPDGVDPDIGIFSVPFGTWRTDIDRPVIVEGRLPDPTNPYELLAPPEARDYGIAVGQEYVVQMPSEEQAAALDLFSGAEGERATLRVVGIGRSTFELSIIPGGGAGFVATPAFHDRFGAPATFIDNLLVRFRPGQGSIEQLERDAREIFDSPRMPVLDADAVAKRVTNGTGLEASGLAMFALAVSLAAAVLIGQALTRSVRIGAEDLPTLDALGFTRAEAAVALARPHLLVAGIGALVAAAGTVALSARYPIGLARQVDPDVGTHADWTVLGVGIPLMTIVLLATVAVSAHRATARGVGNRAARRSRLVTMLANAGASPNLIVGANLALEPGRDRRALPTKPALVGVIVGVIGVIGAQTLLDGIDDAIGNPARFGASWDVQVDLWSAEGTATFDEMMTSVEQRAGVTASALSARALVVIEGVTQPTYAIVPRTGDIDYAVLDGRRPSARGEVALGPETAASFGVELGDTVAALGADGEAVNLRVVGTALLPTTPHSSYDQGAWMAADQLEEVIGRDIGELPENAPDPSSLPPIMPTHVIELGETVEVEEFVAEAAADLDPALFAVEPTTEPIDLTNLRNVRSLPLLFAAFTLILAIGTLAHVSASAVRRRAPELAVLRSLGMTPRNARSALTWQATTLSLIGLALGLPFGVIVGRVVWRVIAEQTPLVFAPPFAMVALALAVPVTLIAAGMIALVPGLRAARLRPAEVLRQE